MNYKISHQKKIIDCEINIPGSKSISNRLLIIQALCKQSFKIENLSDSQDTELLKEALKLKKNTLDLNNAGTSFRFITSFLAIQNKQEFILTGSKRMKERPIKELVKSLQKLGAQISFLEKDGYPPLKIKGGKIKGGKIDIDGTVSSQFISSILLIAPTLKHGVELKINGEIVSKPYIKMTLELMHNFGIKSSWKNNTIRILSQNYIAKNYQVEGDWSSASFWYEIACLSKNCNIKINGLSQNSIQGDKKTSEIFKNIGVNTKFKESHVILTKNKDTIFYKKYNLIDNPDLYQPLSCTLFAKKIKPKFIGIQTLKNKETNRILAVDNELKKIISTKEINTYQDHRMAMSFAPLCLKFGILQINDIEVVKKSYPNFWNDLKKAGFKISPLIL